MERIKLLCSINFTKEGRRMRKLYRELRRIYVVLGGTEKLSRSFYIQTLKYAKREQA